MPTRAVVRDSDDLLLFGSWQTTFIEDSLKIYTLIQGNERIHVDLTTSPISMT